jgi:dienelactone hydrolase
VPVQKEETTFSRARFALAVVIASMAALTSSTATQAAIKTEVIEYGHGDVVLEGYLAYDDAIQGKRPGVMVVHEWMGLGSHVQQRAHQLAEMGYIAFAADIYGKGIRPQDRAEAGKQATIYRSNRQLMRERARAGVQVLQNHALVDSNRIAAIGYCFGGGVALELARSGADVAGVVSFHGNLDTPDPQDAKNIKAKVLVLHGADDPVVPDEQIAAFREEMRQAKVDWQFIAYGNAVHGFTNPDNDAAYNEKADRRSWAAMQQFFAEIFQRP